jgi:hypothetical protein
MNEDSYLDASYEDRTDIDYTDAIRDRFEQDADDRFHAPEPAEQPYDGGGWAGDGSGTDDLADYNQTEADDYANEGDDYHQYADDAGYDASGDTWDF